MWWIGGVEFCQQSSKSQPTLVEILFLNKIFCLCFNLPHSALNLDKESDECVKWRQTWSSLIFLLFLYMRATATAAAAWQTSAAWRRCWRPDRGSTSKNRTNSNGDCSDNTVPGIPTCSSGFPLTYVTGNWLWKSSKPLWPDFPIFVWKSSAICMYVFHCWSWDQKCSLPWEGMIWQQFALEILMVPIWVLLAFA